MAASEHGNEEIEEMEKPVEAQDGEEKTEKGEIEFNVAEEEVVEYALGKTKIQGWVVAHEDMLVFLQRVDEKTKKPLKAFKDVIATRPVVGDIEHKESSKSCCIVSPESFSFTVSQGDEQLVLKCAEEEEVKKLHSMVEKELANCEEVRVDVDGDGDESPADIEEEAWYQEFISTLDEKPGNYKLVHSDKGFHFYTRHVQTKEFPEIRGAFKVHASRKQLLSFYLAQHNLIHLFGGPKAVESVNVLPESSPGAKHNLQVRLRSEWRQPPLFYFSPREFIVSLFVQNYGESTVIAWSSDARTYLPAPSGFVRANILSAGLRITQLDGDDDAGASSVHFCSYMNVDGWLRYAPTVYLNDYLMKTQNGLKAVFNTYDELDNAIETEPPVHEGGIQVVFNKVHLDKALEKRLEEASMDPLNEDPWLEMEVIPGEGEGEEGSGEGEGQGDKPVEEGEKPKKLTKEEKKEQKLLKKQKKAEEKQKKKEEKLRLREEKKNNKTKTKSKVGSGKEEGEAGKHRTELDNLPKDADSLVYFQTRL